MNDSQQPNAADLATLKTIAEQVVGTCPGLLDTAREVATTLLRKYGLPDLDPDHVYYHRFKTSQSSTKTFTGWEHTYEKPYESLTLTQLVVQRFRATDQDNADLLDLYGGFYSAGPEVENFNETNEVRLHGNEVLKDFWEIDFSALYTDKLQSFWGTRADDFRLLAKCNFLSKALQSRQARQLSEDDFQTVVQAVAGPLSWPIDLQALRASTGPLDGAQVCALDIDGHVATDILRIVLPTGRQVVYVPGEAQAFRVFEHPGDLHWWALGQLDNDHARAVVMAHFALDDREAVKDNLTDLMNRLTQTWGKSDHHLLNRKNLVIKGDAFQWLSEQARATMYAEAATSLTSNGDLRKKLWIGYLTAGAKVFGPLAALGWPVALPAIGASLANLGLNVDQAVNGKTAAERKAGVIGAVLSGLDTLFNAPFLKGTGKLAEVGAEIEAAGTEVTEISELEPEGIDPEDELDVEETQGLPGDITPTAPSSTQGNNIPASYQSNELLDGLVPESEPGKFQGIYRLESNPPYAIELDGLPYYVTFFPDSKGAGEWAIVDPTRPNQFASSLPVRLSASGDWVLLEKLGLKGGLNDSEAIAARAAYDMPEAFRGELQDTAEGRRPIRDIEVMLDGTDTAQQQFKAVRTRLYNEARAFYQQPELPPRPFITPLESGASDKIIIRSLLKDSPALVIGESHGEIGSKRFLIKNMRTLAKSGVKTLYMEHLLSDFHQADLDTFLRKGTMSRDLETYLRNLDDGFMLNPKAKYGFLNLVKAARAEKVRIQAIDCLASYRLKGMRPSDGAGQSLNDPTARQKMMNYYAHTVIRADQAVNGPHRWVALMGNSHANTFKGVAGVSELMEGIGLRIDDVNIGTSKGIFVDEGITYPASFDTPPGYLKNDLCLQVEVPGNPLPKVKDLSILLERPGNYTLVRSPERLELVHRSGDKSIVRTEIRVQGDHYSLERPNWPKVSGKPFDSLEALLQALNEMGMSQVG